MILYIIVFILSVVGIFGFFLDIPVLYIISGVASIIDNAIGTLSGRQNNLITPIIAIAISIIIIGAEYGWVFASLIGLTFEAAILSTTALVFIVYQLRK